MTAARTGVVLFCMVGALGMGCASKDEPLSSGGGGAGTDTLETLVGNGMSGTGTLGGDPKNAQLERPHGVFEDRKTGVIYISDSENNRVLKITR